MVKVVLQGGISSTFLHNALTPVFTNTCKVTKFNVLIHSYCLSVNVYCTTATG